MTAHVETYDLPFDGGHAQAHLVSLPHGAEVVDAFMDVTGAVVLTVSPVRSSLQTEQVVYLLGERGTLGTGSRFVRTVFNHSIPAVVHVYVAPANEHTRRDVEHIAKH
jgi:hypothetical protein